MPLSIPAGIRTLPMPLLLLCALLGGEGAQAQEGLYIKGGSSMDWSQSTRFRDIDCESTVPPALFGCVAGNDGQPIGARGDFGRAETLDLALGYQLSQLWRFEAVLSYRPEVDFSGGANFLNVPAEEPVSSQGRSSSGFVVAYVDLPRVWRVRPFLGAGLGASHNRSAAMDYRFPGLSSEAATVTPGGSQLDLAWLATFGAALPLTQTLTLDVSYRYSDLGNMETDEGEATIIRSSGTFPLNIGGTEAPLVTDSVTVSLRYRF